MNLFTEANSSVVVQFPVSDTNTKRRSACFTEAEQKATSRREQRFNISRNFGPVKRKVKVLKLTLFAKRKKKVRLILLIGQTMIKHGQNGLMICFVFPLMLNTRYGTTMSEVQMQ